MKFSEFIFNKSFTKEDFITQDKYLQFSQENSDWIQYAKTDSLFHSFEWRNHQVDLFYPQKPIILFGHSDLSFSQRHANLLNLDFVKRVFAVNAECLHPNVEGLPHGLTNDCHDTARHPILGNQDILCDILSTEKNTKNLLYMNFNTETDIRRPLPMRKHIWDAFSNVDFVLKRECTDKNVNLEDRKQYLQELYDSKFTLCPVGNGIDTVRLWEALYCRTIPIVMADLTMRYFDDLPILWVNNWGECFDQPYLENQYVRILNTDWNLEKLKIGFWKKRIEEVYKDKV